MNLFLVTSALDTQYSLFSFEERIQQTIATVESIRKYAPGSTIVLVEGGRPLTDNLKNRLTEYFNHIFDYTDTDAIKMSQSASQYAVDNVGHSIKTPCEAFMLMNTTKQIPVEKFNRIFKISGRYVLTEKFNLADHINARGKYVFLPKAPVGEKSIVDEVTNTVVNNKSSTDFSDYCYETTLYSFCGSILPIAVQNFEIMFNNIIKLYSSESYIDIETAMYLTVDHTLVEEVSPIGIAGQLGMAQGLSIDK